MKLQIDFENKKIKLLDEVQLGNLVKILQGLFPDKWEEFKLEGVVEYVNWYNPVVIRDSTLDHSLDGFPHSDM